MNIEKLKALAEAATSGPWFAKHNGYYYDVTIADDRYAPWVASVSSSPCGGKEKANAEYIAAANPAVVLELVGQYELLLNAMAEIQHYSPAGSTCYEIATRAINAIEDDQ